MKYKIILWDFDGTLADTGQDVWNSLAYAAKKCGGSLPKEYSRDDSNLGKPMEEIFRQIIPYPGEEKYQEFEEQVRVHYRQISMYSNTYLYPGIYELLVSMKKQKVVNYIITLKPREALEGILCKKGWAELFDRWISPDSLPGSERTKSELISYVLQQTCYAKADYVYIGDTWSDAAAAYKNGIDCIGVTYGDGDTAMLLDKKPKYHVDDVSGIEKIIKEGIR